MAPPQFLVVNGVPQTSNIPSVTSLLESTPGAYTTTRTCSSATLLLFYRRHLLRLHRSLRLLGYSDPRRGADDLTARVNASLRLALDLAATERERAGSDAELAVTALVGGERYEEAGLGVWVHLGFYVPTAFGTCGAHLALAGRGRGEAAEAKYSDWVRQRKGLEKMRPPAATELLLSNDGDHILEGSVTNFFVVCRKDDCSYEVQTAPVTDRVLAGVMRQLVIEACTSLRIPFQEAAPSWADHDLWEEAFITSSLRLVQHVETIQVPNSCENLHLKTWKDVSWAVKRFEGAGVITTQIQREIVSKAGAEGYPLSDISEELNRDYQEKDG